MVWVAKLAVSFFCKSVIEKKKLKIKKRVCKKVTYAFKHNHKLKPFFQWKQFFNVFTELPS